MNADSCTLKLSNQKNGWRGVCINQQAHVDPTKCPVKAIGRRYLHITANKKHKKDTFLSTYLIGDKKYDVTDENIRSAVKFAGTALNRNTGKCPRAGSEI